MAAPKSQMMCDAPEAPEPAGFNELQGTGDYLFEAGPLRVINPLEKSNWPILGSNDHINHGFWRFHCLCLQSGWSGQALENPTCQYLCCQCSAKDKFKLVTALPLLEDENCCQVKLICCDYGWSKFRLNARYCCLDVNLGGEKTAAS
jgi:hypothetical protein